MNLYFFGNEKDYLNVKTSLKKLKFIEIIHAEKRVPIDEGNVIHLYWDQTPEKAAIDKVSDKSLLFSFEKNLSNRKNIISLEKPKKDLEQTISQLYFNIVNFFDVQIIDQERIDELNSSYLISSLLKPFIHDINNPLTVIFGFSEALHRNSSIDEKSLGKIEKILTAAKKVQKSNLFIGDLFKYYYENDFISVNEIVEETIFLMKSRIQIRDIQLTNEIQNFEEVKISKVPFVLTLMSLFLLTHTYFIDHKQEEKTSLLKIDKDGDTIIIHYEDNGIFNASETSKDFDINSYEFQALSTQVHLLNGEFDLVSGKHSKLAVEIKFQIES